MLAVSGYWLRGPVRGCQSDVTSTCIHTYGVLPTVLYRYSALLYGVLCNYCKLLRTPFSCCLSRTVCDADEQKERMARKDMHLYLHGTALGIPGSHVSYMGAWRL